MLESLKNKNKTVGVKQTIKAVENGAAVHVFIACDADEKVINSLKEICHANSVEVTLVDTMKQLGKACEIEVGASAASILK